MNNQLSGFKDLLSPQSWVGQEKNIHFELLFMIHMQGKSRGWPIAFVLSLVLALSVSITPFYSEVIRGGVMQVFAFVCHQLPLRSPHIGGVQLAVCHRCLGIYWALPVAALIFGISRGSRVAVRIKNLTIVMLAGLPAGIDWLGDILGFWENTTASRFITGAVFGLAAGYLLAEGISDIVRASGDQKNGPALAEKPGGA